MFETETVEPCLVWKFKCVCVCGRGEGCHAPWPPSGCAPVYTKCWFKGLFVLR